MKNRVLRLFFLLLILTFIFFHKMAWAQLILGQYEDEAPFRTWNTFGLTTAPTLALGETQFAFTSDCATSLSNPALLTRLPGINVTLSSSFSIASFSKYSIVNTGVIQTDKNVFLSVLALDFAGVSAKVKNWAFALSAGLIENYYRPSVEQQSYYRDQLSYTLKLNQKGHLLNIHFSLANQILYGLSVGVGFNYVYGYLDLDIEENWITSDISIDDEESHQFKGFYLNCGLAWDLKRNLSVAVVFRTPYLKKAVSESSIRYSAPAGDTDIRIESSGESDYRQPWILGLGASYRLSPKLRIASDFTFYDWSKYSVIYFKPENGLSEEEEALYRLERDFKDIIKIGVGIEYLSSIKFFGPKAQVPLRAGLSYDSQPMKVPNSSYLYFTFGFGIHWRKLRLDLGMLIGKEMGSGDSLFGQKLAMSLSYEI